MAVWSRLFSGIFGVGVGIAAADAVTPVIEVARQEAWKGNANRVLDPAQLAALRAQGLIDEGVAEEHASRSGYGPDKLAALAQLALHAPASADVRTLRRRGLIGEDLLHRAYAKSAIEQQYWQQLDALINEHLSPEVVALAIVRGLIPDPGILPVSPPSGTGAVPRFPVFDVDAVKEAASEGFDLTRLSVLAGIAGRPMSAEAAAEAYYKGIIELTDYERAVSESDVRNEWRDAILENQRFRLRPSDWAGLWLRGWVTEKEALAGGAQYGATAETMRRLYENRGRPATTHQVHLGYARGGVLPGFEGDEKGAFRRAVEQSDIRTEYTEVLWAQRYTYPSAFVLRALTTDGTFTGAQAEEILLESGWRPDLAKQAAAKWAGGGAAGGKALTLSELRDEYEGGFVTETEFRAALAGLGYSGAAADLEVELGDARRVKAERARVVTALHKLYVARELDDTGAAARLGEVGVGTEAVARMLTYWQVERDAATAQLTAAQLRSAYRKQLITRAEAIARLEALGYSATDAGLYLDS